MTMPLPTPGDPAVERLARQLRIAAALVGTALVVLALTLQVGMSG